MPLTFLNPAMLFGAAAAALPVIIHFLSRRRVRRLPFSDLRFLNEVQARQARSLGIRRWLLLLLRILAVLCIVMAVAGPRWGGLGPGSGKRSLLFVVDNSASMNTRDDDGATRLELAVAACEEMIANLPGESVVQVMTAGAVTASLFGDWLPGGRSAAAGLSAVRPGDGTVDLADVLREAARQAARAPGSPVEVVLIGDLQDVETSPEWKQAAQALRDARPSRLLVHRVGAPASGGGVASVTLPGRALRPGENIDIAVEAVAAHAEEVFSLELDGRPAAETVASSPPGEPTLLRFPLTVPGTGRHVGVVRKASDAFGGDDSRPFVLDVPEAVEVLVAHGADRPGDGAGGRGGWRYVVEALSPGGSAAPFRVVAATSSELTTGAVARSDAVVLVDPDPLGRVALNGLVDWLRGGGALLLLAGDPAQQTYLAGSLLPAFGLPPEAAFSGAGAGAGEQRARIVAPEHPVFAGLDDQALETFADIRWRRWFAFAEGDGRVLLTLTGEDPLLVDRDLGDGRIAVLATDLHPSGNDLAASPMALPFFQRLLGWLAQPGGSAAAVNLIVGQEAVVRSGLSASAAALERVAEITATGPAEGERRTVELVWRRDVPLLRAGIVERAGFVTFRAGNDTVGLVAAGVPAAETMSGYPETEHWRRRFAELDLQLARDLTGTEPGRLLGILGGQDLAPGFLTLALLVLLLELGLGRGTAPPAQGLKNTAN